MLLRHGLRGVAVAGAKLRTTLAPDFGPPDNPPVPKLTGPNASQSWYESEDAAVEAAEETPRGDAMTRCVLNSGAPTELYDQPRSAGCRARACSTVFEPSRWSQKMVAMLGSTTRAAYGKRVGM